MRIQCSLLPHQIAYLQAKERNTLLTCGVGGGKTLVGCLDAGLRAERVYPAKLLVITLTKDQFTRNILEPFNEEAHVLGFDTSFRASDRLLRFTWTNPRTLKRRVGEAWSVAMQDRRTVDRLRGVNSGGSWLDELRDQSLYALQVAQSRSRKVRGAQNKATSTPDGFNWMHDYFVEQPDRNPELRAARRVIYGGSSHQNFFLPADFRKDLELSYDPVTYQQEVLGQFVNLGQGRVFHQFDRARHCRTGPEFEYQPTLPVGMAFDFGIISSVSLFQWWRDCLWVFDEVQVDPGKTWQAVRGAVAKVFDEQPVDRRVREVVVVGDAAGEHGSPRSNWTDYEIIRSVLRDHLWTPDWERPLASGFQVTPFERVREWDWKYRESLWKANPAVRDTVTILNTMFHRNQVNVHPRCTRLIRDLEQVSYRPGTQDDIDKRTRSLTHLSDTLRYAAKAVYWDGPGQPVL